VDYAFFFILLIGLAPVILLISVVYVFLIDRVMTAPQDALWHMGRWVTGADADPAELREHLRGWLIKGFWLALLGTALPQHVANVTQPEFEQIFADPALVAFWSIGLLYMVDVAFGVTGYIFTSRALDAHIRSSNPYMWGWIFALICYPPFILMGRGGPLDYRSQFDWHEWLAGSDVLLVLWGVALVTLNAVYVWGSVVFGPRFSNLTHRGILTNGPFRFFKHPAYLAKNLNWWLAYLPFLTTMGPLDAARNCLLLLGVNFIYYMRARTEEWHLMEDPDYRAYSAWIAQHGVLARLRRRMFGAGRLTDRG
jgi:protein-S-isoprenylcysteine O-methyltransferase Ste14